jgi:hypothetical protein
MQLLTDLTFLFLPSIGMVDCHGVATAFRPSDFEAIPVGNVLLSTALSAPDFAALYRWDFGYLSEETVNLVLGVFQ